MVYDNTPTVNVVILSVYRSIIRTGRNNTSRFMGLVAIKRTDNNGWALPGGYQERPESIRDAAKREVLEETGISCGHLGIYDIQTTPDGNVNLVFWQATILEDVWLEALKNFVPNSEVSEIELKSTAWETPFPMHNKVVTQIFSWDD